MRHLSLQQLSARVDEALSGVSLEIVDRHLSGCEECRGRVSRIERVDQLLVQLVRREPGEAWLARVEEEIATRLNEETGLRFRFPPAPVPAGRAPSSSPVASSSSRAPRAAAPPLTPAPARAPIVPVAEAAPAPPVAARATAPPSAPRPRVPAVTRRPEAPRWATHADRLAKARRLGADRPREAMLPLVAGLLGGAAAGALIVSLVFGTRPQSATRRATHSPAAAASPVRAPEKPTGFVEPQTPAPVVTPVELPPPAAPAPAVSPAEPATSKAAAPGAARPQADRETPRVAAREPDPAARRIPPAARPKAPRPAAVAAAAPEARGGDGDWPMLCGLVVDDTGSPISGARVLLADLELGVRTDRRGRFCISGPAGVRTMSVVALGFATHRQLVTIAEPAADLRIVLGAGR